MSYLPGVERLATVAVNGFWQGSLIAAALWLALRGLRGLAPAQRFMVWAAGFLLAMALPFVTLARGSAGATPVHAGEKWALALLGVWSLLSVVRAGRLVAQGVALRRIWRGARPVAVSGAIAEVLAGEARRPVLCVSDEVSAPSVIGFFSPRMLVPAEMMAGMSAAELRQVVLHECEHLRRYDDWLNLAQKVALAVFPLNPALLWVDRRLGLERELACDARVVAATGAGLDYAASLTRLAEERMGSRRLVLALSAWGRRSELGRRVMELVAPARAWPAARVRLGSLALGAGLALGVFGLVKMPALVSFGGPPMMAEVAAAPAVEGRLASAAMPLEGGVSATAESGAGGRLRLISATMPASRGESARSGRPATRNGRSSTRVRAGVKRRSEFVARAAIAQDRQDRAQGYFVPVRFSPSYAAVPFGDGWLIVQL